MKKISFIALAALAVCSISCNKEIATGQKDDFSPKVLTATTDDNATTKTSLDGTSVVWTSSDVISAFDVHGQNHASTKTEVSASGKDAQFEIGSISVEDDVMMALYPYDENATYDTNDYSVETTIPTVQNIVANSFANGANVAIAEGLTDKLKFRNVGAFLCLSVANDNVKSVKLSSNSSMTGNVVIDYNEGEPELIFDDTKFVSDYVELKGDFVKGQKYYFVVAPGEYDGLTITLTDDNNRVASFKNSNTLTVSRNENLFIAALPVIPDNKWVATDPETPSQPKTVTWIASEQGYTNGTQYTSATVDSNISLAFGDGGNDGKYYDTGTGIRIYANGKVTVSAADGCTISEVVLTFSATGYTGTFAASTGDYSLSTTTGTWKGSASSVVLTNTATSGHARIQTITVNYTAGSAPTTYTVSVDGKIANGTVTADPTTATEGTTVTLTATPNSDYEFDSWNVTNATTSEVINVVDNKFTMPAADVNVSATFKEKQIPTFASLAELVAADLASGTEVNVSFENVPIKDIYVTSGGYRNGIIFDIKKGEKDIEIYYQNVPTTWVKGGTVSGTLNKCPWKLYNGTWELAPASGWSWTNLDYTAPVVLAAPAITTHPINAAYVLNESAKNLTVVASGNPSPTYQWYSNTSNSNENGTVLTGETNTSYKPSTSAVGTFYYYCVATNSEGSAASNVATITVKEPAIASLPFNFNGGKSDIATTDGMSENNLGSDYNSAPKLKFDDQGDNVIINFNSAATRVTYTIKGNGTDGTYAFDVMESADGIDYTTVHSHSDVTETKTYTDDLTSSSRFVKFVYTTKSTGNVALGNICISNTATYTLTINSATNGSITATVDGSPVVSGAKIEEGKIVTITATPDSNYEVKSVSAKTASGTLTVTDNKFVMPAGAVTVSAEFEESADKVYKTVLFGKDYNSAAVSSYTGSFSVTNNDFTVDVANFNNNNNVWDYVKTGNKSAASVGTITTSKAIDKAVTKVAVTIDAVTATSVKSITLYSGSSASSCTTSEGTFKVANGTQTVTLSSPSANKFYKISFDCDKGSSNGLVTVSKVEYYAN